MRIERARRLILNDLKIMVVFVSFDHNNNRSNNNTIARNNSGSLRAPYLIAGSSSSLISLDDQCGDISGIAV
jgi:GH18 family chitinase